MPTFDELSHFYCQLEAEFNQRQFDGEDCEDIIELMINLIFTLKGGKANGAVRK